jgi:hypothetical protein
MDILVTTPKGQHDSSRQEAAEMIQQGGGYYFRKFGKIPTKIQKGDKVFYCDSGYITGFAVVDDIKNEGNLTCGTTGKNWGDGNYLIMRADSWQWINPIPHDGFRGFKYVNLDYRVVGNWRDPKPETSKHRFKRP